jgi:type II secretory pathway component PulF
MADHGPHLRADRDHGQDRTQRRDRQRLESVIASVKAGGTIGEPLKHAGVFPPMVGQMVGVGEETGALDTMLSKIAECYEDEVAAIK